MVTGSGPVGMMRNGKSCGGFGAWSKHGGAAPLCFPEDITTRRSRRTGRAAAFDSLSGFAPLATFASLQ
jgi:hypothetical protein